MARRKSSPTRHTRRKSRKTDPATRQSWLYGYHTVRAVLANPNRRCVRVLCSDAEVTARLSDNIAAHLETEIAIVSGDYLDEVLPDGAVHQGIAALVEPLAPVSLEEICETTKSLGATRIVVLDQVTDPHNIGAIVRTAVAFQAAAVVMQDRHAPPVTGVLAKAASGGLESCPLVRVTNLARALETLQRAGVWCIGLDRDSETALRDAKLAGAVALVLGAEGGGLRRLTREMCDGLAKIPHGGEIASLNVSNAAAIALYELSQPATAGKG